MPSLKLSSFAQALTGGDQIDYIEIRLGEAYAIPFTINQPSGDPQDLTDWTFTVSSDVYTANFTYNAAGDLSAVSDFTDQANPSVPADLTVSIISPATQGQGILTVPADINPNPTTLVTADGDNTLLNIITITATYPSGYSISGTPFDNVRKLLIGLIVRFGG